MNQRALGFVAELQNWPRRAEIQHRYSTVVTGNAFSIAHDANQDFGYHNSQQAAANGDTFTNGFLLRPGNYTLSALGITAGNRGIIDWYIDDALVASGQDWYGGVVYNIVQTASVVVKGVSIYHVLKGGVNGKNPSSSGYDMTLTAFSLKPTTD